MTTARFPDLDGASVFITGGGSGIGAALVAGFAAQGAHVTYVDLHNPDHTDGADFIACDVTDTAALHAAMETAAAKHGRFKAVINNAAMDQRHKIADITPQIWDDMLAVNLRAYFFGCQKAASLMAENGSIINFTSTSYMIGTPDLLPYISANAGISGLTRTLARDLGPQRIRVNALAPGWVMTDRQKRLWATPEAMSEFIKRQCLPDLMQPDHIVGPALFLASNAAAMMTGQTMIVDAGVITTG